MATVPTDPAIPRLFEVRSKVMESALAVETQQIKSRNAIAAIATVDFAAKTRMRELRCKSPRAHRRVMHGKGRSSSTTGKESVTRTVTYEEVQRRLSIRAWRRAPFADHVQKIALGANRSWPTTTPRRPLARHRVHPPLRNLDWRAHPRCRKPRTAFVGENAREYEQIATHLPHSGVMK